MEQYSQNQRERLNYLEFRVYFAGQIGRSDLVSRFGVSEAAATRDLAIYRDTAPGNIELDQSTKLYRITESFELCFLKNIEPQFLLRALVEGIGNDFGTTPTILVPCELPKLLHAPDPDILAAVSRAIYGKKVLKITYLSASSGRQTREIVPFAIAGTGIKWQVRAFDRKRACFLDLVINRIQSAKIAADDAPLDSELKDNDDDWNRMANLEIIAHPDAPKKKAMTELEYQMHDGVLRLKVRAALASYFLRLWNVDCSPDHHLSDYRLWLRNENTLRDVANFKIAPGVSEFRENSISTQDD